MRPGVVAVAGWETSGDDYERFMGRWSRPLAPLLLDLVGAPPGGTWADVGCGTGVLTEAVLDSCAPARVVGLDPSAAFTAHAAERLAGRAHVVRAGAEALPLADASCDVVVSSLVLNFVADRAAALAEAVRVARRGGRVAGCVWDYAEGMRPLRAFWDAASALDPAARALDEGVRFADCGADGLRGLFEGAGLGAVRVVPLDVPVELADGDDLWTPFLRGGAPAPSYVQSLAPERQQALRQAVLARLPARPDGALHLTARAWAAVGVVGPGRLDRGEPDGRLGGLAR